MPNFVSARITFGVAHSSHCVLVALATLVLALCVAKEESPRILAEMLLLPLDVIAARRSLRLHSHPYGVLVRRGKFEAGVQIHSAICLRVNWLRNNHLAENVSKFVCLWQGFSKLFCYA